MKRYIQIHLTNGDSSIFKCTNITKTSQGYLFECEDKNRTFLLDNIKSIDDPFKLPNGFKFDSGRKKY